MKYPFLFGIIFIVLSTLVVAEADNETAQGACGDYICGSYENPSNCNKDCKAGFMDYVTCAMDKDSCFDDAWYDKSKNVMFICLGIIALLYMKAKGFI